jgi:hypothetical protein
MFRAIHLTLECETAEKAIALEKSLTLDGFDATTRYKDRVTVTIEHLAGEPVTIYRDRLLDLIMHTPGR